MIVIFEGPDNSGKTNIIDNLIKRHPEYKKFKGSLEFEIFKNEVPKELPYIIGEFFASVIKQLGIKNLILDRFYPSEYVYSRVYNRYRDDESNSRLEDAMTKVNSAIIYCYKHKYENFYDEIVDIEMIDKIKKGYESFLRQTKLPYLMLDTTDENLERQTEIIEAWLSLFEEF